MNPRRSDRRASAEAILDTAERLIGQRGVDGVSLRQIGEAAGLAAPSAVQYHFGDKTGLIQAIVERHGPRLEARRYELCEPLIRDSRPAPARLVEAVFKPLFEIRDEAGRASYALFLREVRQRGYADMLAETRLRQPHLSRIMEYLRNEYAGVPEQVFWWRHKTVVMYITNFIIMLDEEGPLASSLAEDRLQSAFAAAVAIYAGPVASDPQ